MFIKSGERGLFVSFCDDGEDEQDVCLPASLVRPVLVTFNSRLGIQRLLKYSRCGPNIRNRCSSAQRLELSVFIHFANAMVDLFYTVHPPPPFPLLIANKLESSRWQGFGATEWLPVISCSAELGNMDEDNNKSHKLFVILLIEIHICWLLIILMEQSSVRATHSAERVQPESVR